MKSLRFGAGALAVVVLSLIASPAGAQACVGDCNGSGSVSVDELVKGVNIALGNALQDCAAFDCGDTGLVSIDCLVRAVNAALSGCPRGALNISKITIEPATGSAGELMEEPLIVEVTDAGGEAVDGVSVTFAVQRGGGSVEPTVAITGADGRAATRWRLGIAPVDNRLLASVEGDSISYDVRARLAAPLQPERFGDVNTYLEDEESVELCQQAVGNSECSTFDLAFDPMGRMVLGVAGDVLTMSADRIINSLVLSGDQFIHPRGIAYDQDGNLWMADIAGPIRLPLDPGAALRVVSPDGVVSTVLDAPLLSPSGVRVDAAGRVYVSDPCLGQILRYDPARDSVDAVLTFDATRHGLPIGFTFEPGTGRIVVLTSAQGSDCPVSATFDGGIYAANVDDEGFGPIEPLVERFAGLNAGTTLGGGVTFDAEGNLYAVFADFDGLLYSALWVLPKGDSTLVPFLVAPGPGGRIFANPAFGQGEFGESTLYVTLQLRGQAPRTARGVERIGVGIRGIPLTPGR